MRNGTITKNRKKDTSLSGLDRVCLVCPLSDCFSHHSSCLQKPENIDLGTNLLRDMDRREKWEEDE